MKHIVCICSIVLLGHLSSIAHPSYGIIVTDEYEVIFSDILHDFGTIWKIDASGKLAKVLTGEHSHFLFQDHQGNIWGTNHEYIEATDGNRNTLWKLNQQLEKTIVIPPTDIRSEFTGVNFVVDSEDQIYFAYEGQIYVRKANELPSLYVDRKFAHLMSMQMDKEENIYVVDTEAENGSIYMITKEKQIFTIATNLKELNPPNPPYKEARFNMLFGTFVNTDGNVYVANSGSRRISLIREGQAVEQIYHSNAPWYPVAITIKDDITYIMEVGFVSKQGHVGPRIIKIAEGEAIMLANVEDAFTSPSSPGGDGLEMRPENQRPNIYGWILGLGGILLVLFLWELRKRRLTKA